MPTSNETPLPLRLHALGGGDAPPDLADDLRRLLRFPPEALDKLWQALGPCLAHKLSDETERLLDVFCAAYRLSDADLARVIKACRFLIQGAARLDVPALQLADDLDRLCPDAPLIKELLLAGYEQAKSAIRQEIVQAALVAHGKLLIGAQFRVDVIDTSERGTRLRQPVVLLTLQYCEGAEAGRITLQVLPDMMGQLKGICEQVLA
jgi:hypothetical protein